MQMFILPNRLIIIVLLWCPNLLAQPKPTKEQLQWQNMEFNIFMHFGPNTFTGAEWGSGKEKSMVFNPKQLDCNQWCAVAKAAGAKGILITAKHHDGFCLWPSKYSKHTVQQSSWKNGKGDVLRELSLACKKAGLRFGVYISPWDRNHPDYGTEKYNDIFCGMMEELFTGYGPIFELWWDGANGEGPNGKKQIYDWKRYEELVRRLSPQTLIFSDIGPDIRWVGNEDGVAGSPNYNTLHTEGFGRGANGPKQDTLTTGNKYGKNWIPAECDVSIRPGWFWHAEENKKVKSPKELLQLYAKSVCRGAVLLLNVPPDTSGKIDLHDVQSLMGFKKLKDSVFAHNLAKKGQGYFVPHNGSIPLPEINDGNLATGGTIAMPHIQSLGIQFSKPVRINTILLREDLTKGQQVMKAKLLLMNTKHELLKEIALTTIGRKKMIRFPDMEVGIIGLVIEEQNKPAIILEIEAYSIGEEFLEINQ